MKVVSTFYRGNDDNEYRDSFDIEIDGKSAFSVEDGEPEDSNLSTDFNDVVNIPALMHQMYELGKAGVEVEFEDKTVE